MVRPEDFRPIRLISEGVSGKVYMVEDNVTKKTFALKVVRKRSDNLLQTVSEKDALCSVAGIPWFLSLDASMHDDTNFYLLTVCLPLIHGPFNSGLTDPRSLDSISNGFAE